MSTAHNGNDYERLKEELRRLKRRTAPWYFESALHQRLHGGAARRRRRLRPITTGPVLLVAIMTLLILGLATYVVMVRTNLIVPGVPPGAAVTPDSSGRADSIRAVPEKPPARAGAALRSAPPSSAARDTVRGRRNEATVDTSSRRDTVPRGLPRDTVAKTRDTSLVRTDTSALPPGAPDR